MTRQDTQALIDSAIKSERRRIIKELKKIEMPTFVGDYGFQEVVGFRSFLVSLIDVLLTKEDNDYFKQIEADSTELS